MAINEKYSYRDFTNFWKGKPDIDLTDGNGSTIVGTCFYHDSYPFPNMSTMGLTNITFRDCNLDNVIVPDDCTMINCSNRFIRELNGDDWLCTKDGVYLELLNG